MQSESAQVFMRWKYETRGMILNDEFVPPACCTSYQESRFHLNHVRCVAVLSCYERFKQTSYFVNNGDFIQDVDKAVSYLQRLGCAAMTLEPEQRASLK